MNKLILLSIAALGVFAPLNAREPAPAAARPYESYDVTAFCSYSSFHPSEYLTDNNWDILCAFTEPGPRSKLDSLGIAANSSQLRLLEVGGLLRVEKGIYTTLMPIFGCEETRAIRSESKAFADSIFVSIRPRIEALVEAFGRKGYSAQTFSLLFSYLLDGYIWDDKRITPPSQMTNHGTWSGAYWAMYEKRAGVIGTNGYGPVKVNWSDELGYNLRTATLLSFAKEVKQSNGEKIADRAMIEKLSSWGLVDPKGRITVPVIHYGNGDPIDVLCLEITTELSDAVKRYCSSTWAQSHDLESEDIAEVIFYHEVMWDLLDRCEAEAIVTRPAILAGEETGSQHFGDITFIVIEG